MDRTTTDEEWDMAVRALTVRYPAGMSYIVQNAGPVPMPGPDTEQWKIDDALVLMERICKQVEA